MEQHFETQDLPLASNTQLPVELLTKIWIIITVHLTLWLILNRIKKEGWYINNKIIKTNQGLIVD